MRLENSLYILKKKLLSLRLGFTKTRLKKSYLRRKLMQELANTISVL